MAQNYRRTLTKHRKVKKGHGWTKLEKIEMDFQIYGISVDTCLKMSLTQLENHSQLLCGRDFANERLLLCQKLFDL